MDIKQLELLKAKKLELDLEFDEELNLLGKGTDRHDTRGTAHYALMNLMVGGDVKRTEDAIRGVIACQYQQEGRVYFGTFKRYPLEPEPCIDPIVWDDYDANWRDFISLDFAIILEEYKDKLSDEILRLIDRSVFCAVTSSIGRYYDQYVPMQTNIELMNIFVSDSIGRYFGDERMMMHAKGAAILFLEKFKKTDTVPEFNSATYYGVNFTALGAMMKYSKDKDILEMANYVYDKIWDSFTSLYNPTLENLCGPFSRAYEMDISEHCSLGGIFYKCLGIGEEKYAKMANPMFYILDLQIPEAYKSRITATHIEEKEVFHQYNELIELFPVYESHNLCNCTAYMRDNLMIGAARDVHNTSAQLHPATIYWKHEGTVYWMRLSRRRPDRLDVPHHWYDAYNCTASKNSLVMDITSLGADDREFFLEFHGKKINESKFTDDKWILPGLTLDVHMVAEDVKITKTRENRLEMSIIHRGVKNRKILIDLKGFVQNGC